MFYQLSRNTVNTTLCGIDPVSSDFKRLSIAGWFMIDQVAESRPKENGDSAVKNDVEWTFRKMTTHRVRCPIQSRTLETVPASAQSDKEAEQFDESLSAC